MILPKRSDPRWDVYVWNDVDEPQTTPFRCVASCLTPEGKEAVLRLYSGRAFWAEVSKVIP